MGLGLGLFMGGMLLKSWVGEPPSFGSGMRMTMTTLLLFSRGERQRSWLPSLLASRRGMGGGHDHTPPLLKIRRAEAIATFPPFF